MKEYSLTFGRCRICPGIHLAEASVFIHCAMSLAVFNISKPVLDGAVLEPNIEFTSGMICHPVPYECCIKARSSKAEALLPSVDDA
ncbi:hypothetical protein SCP_0205840 [Sparassis crispa]|uniref:Uncharacterized protein n=1 Tax=Sparassis crispa TaxID=139825 RepID=A0A401GB26_9APHY|nr:hypothetical protein SCP_0205840 [Sparassis crispa]GBE79386.1 hypothetical protein SCP_0205840 [Sparassis crispa]